MSEPTTAEGRALLDTVRHSIYDAEMRAAILAIEAAAAEAERARIRAAVEGLPFRRMTGEGLDVGGTTGDLEWDWDEWDDVVTRVAVLAAIDGETK